MSTSGGRELSLDEGVLMHLMSFLDAPSLCAASMTCRTWNDLASDDYLWRSLQSSCGNPMLNRTETSQCTSAACNPSSEGSCWASEAASSSMASSSGLRRDPRSFKDSYALGHNWRRGRASKTVAQFPGSSWNCAVRLHPDGVHSVLASAGTGGVDVVDLSTGERCPHFAGIQRQHMEVDAAEAHDPLDALYACVAVAPACRQVAFGGFDGTISLFDVARGSLLATAQVPAPQPAVTALGFCSIQNAQVLAAGLADGRVALTPLQQWQVCLETPVCGLHGGACNVVGCYGQSPLGVSSPRQVNGPWVTVNLGAGVEVRRIKGECGTGAGLSVVAGTSGGHVMVVDGAAGQVRSSLVGSCSCPVKCLSLHCSDTGAAPIPEPGQAASMGGAHNGNGGRSRMNPAAAAPQALSRVVYAGFDHSMLGNGHYNAIYAWDVNSTERIALLFPGEKGLRSHRGGRGVCCRRQSSNDLGSMIQSVWADGWKVAVSAGKSVTVFETRTWRPLYELSIPSPEVPDASSVVVPGAVRAAAPVNLEKRFAQMETGSSVLAPCSFNGPVKMSTGDVCSSPKGLDRGGMSDSAPGSGVSGTSNAAPGCQSLPGRCQDLSPSPEKRRSFEKARAMEEVSDSPGSIAFFGSTMALALKNETVALLNFGEPQHEGCANRRLSSDCVHVKRFV